MSAYRSGCNPNTAAQRTVRKTFGDAVKSRQEMSHEERFIFNRKAANLLMSGYNLYISEYMKTRIRVLPKPDSGESTSGRNYFSSCQRTVASVSPPFINSFKERLPRKTFQYESG